MIRKEDVLKLAELSRIEVPDEELNALTKDIEAILDYVGELQEVAVEEPESEVGVLRNVMREDGEPHERGKYTKALLDAAPDLEKNMVRVKKILE